jgi:hypothetical protein
MELIRIIKKLDAFKAPVYLTLHRRNKTSDKKQFNWRMGSGFGGLITIFLVAMIVVIVLVMSLATMNQRNDKFI